MGYKISITIVVIAVFAVARYGKGQLPARVGLALYVLGINIAVLGFVMGAPEMAVWAVVFGSALHFVLTGAWHPFASKLKDGA
jgi:hypothetical protein